MTTDPRPDPIAELLRTARLPSRNELRRRVLGLPPLPEPGDDSTEPDAAA